MEWQSPFDIYQSTMYCLADLWLFWGKCGIWCSQQCLEISSGISSWKLHSKVSPWNSPGNSLTKYSSQLWKWSSQKTLFSWHPNETYKNAIKWNCVDGTLNQTHKLREFLSNEVHSIQVYSNIKIIKNYLRSHYPSELQLKAKINCRHKPILPT